MGVHRGDEEAEEEEEEEEEEGIQSAAPVFRLLQAEFEIINAVVTELSKQVEQAKLQVTKDTPVFSTIKEAVIPNVRKSPKRTQTVLIFSLVGLIFSIVFVLAIEPLRNLLKEIKKN